MWPAKRRSVLWALNRAALAYWHEQLLATPHALAYLASRGWPDARAIASRYQLGYAPGRSDEAPGFVRWVLRGGFPGTTDRADLEQALVAAGLARRTEEGRIREHFVGRLMFPIAVTGRLTDLPTTARVAGFGGRVIPGAHPVPAEEGKGPPKYLNTGETALFRKRKTLYGLSWAAGAIDKQKRVVVLEGYMDYLRVAECGVADLVACCGTALTPDHVAALQKAARMAPRTVQVQTSTTRTTRTVRGAAGTRGNAAALDVVLMTDADIAGRKAAERGARRVLRAGAVARIATFAGGKDPDDLLREAGNEAPTLIARVIQEAATPVANYLAVQEDAATTAGVPVPWAGSLIGLVRTLRDIQHRGALALATVQAQDAKLVCERLTHATGLAIAPGNLLDIFHAAPVSAEDGA